MSPLGASPRGINLGMAGRAEGCEGTKILASALAPQDLKACAPEHARQTCHIPHATCIWHAIYTRGKRARQANLPHAHATCHAHAAYTRDKRARQANLPYAYHMPHVTRHIPHATCIGHATCHLHARQTSASGKSATCHMHTTCNMPHATCI